jgi:hypothetical protein
MQRLPGAVPDQPRASGACDRYANHDGTLVRVDPVLLRRTLVDPAAPLVRSAVGGAVSDVADRGRRCRLDGDLLLSADEVFVTGVGSSTTYPDYKPAPFIVSSRWPGVDMVTVVTEGIFSYCS